MYSARILNVDLSKGKLADIEIGDSELRKYLGGVGLAARILWDKTDAKTDPLSPENPLLFVTGPLTGTPVPGSGRHSVAAISPLTGIWGEAHAGGTWGFALRHTPYMAITFTCAADRPVYLWLNGPEPKLRDASHVWGKDTFETDVILRQETDPRASVACIGQAGERLVRIASVMNDGVAARAAGRSGLGAVMGSKKLKAVVVRGASRPAIVDPDGLKQSIRQYFPTQFLPVPDIEERQKVKEWTINNRGPIKNYRLGQLPGFDEKLREAMGSGESYHCAGCPVSCGMTMRFGERNVNGEHCGPLGSNLLIEDFDALYQAYGLCNRYGIDTISAGAIMGFAFECFEKGLITEADTGGIALRWGDHDAMLKMLRQIGEREGFGALLGEGAKKAAERIGGNAIEYAMQVKGLETSYHDPRYQNATALVDATSNRGADHMDGYVGRVTRGYAEPYLSGIAKKASLDHFATEGTGRFVAWCQDLSNVIDGVGTCYYLCRGKYRRQPAAPYNGVQPTHLAAWLSHVTGWDIDLDELMTAGERLFQLKRAFNVRRGISRKDDTLPMRFQTLRRGGKSEAANNLPRLGAMLNEYYACRGWNEIGIPTKERLEKLGLADVAKALHG